MFQFKFFKNTNDLAVRWMKTTDGYFLIEVVVPRLVEVRYANTPSKQMLDRLKVISRIGHHHGITIDTMRLLFGRLNREYQAHHNHVTDRFFFKCSHNRTAYVQPGRTYFCRTRLPIKRYVRDGWLIEYKNPDGLTRKGFAPTYNDAVRSVHDWDQLVCKLHQ